MTGHTPTPWRSADYGETTFQIFGAERGTLVAHVPYRPDVLHIVRCVNLFDEFVTAFAALIDGITHADGVDWPELARARAVLQRAREP